MEHLTVVDASFLEAEDADPHVSLAIGAVSMLEEPLPDEDALVSALRQRMLTIPRCRQTVRRHPFDVGAPEWVEDANLDLAHHCGVQRWRSPAMTMRCSGWSATSGSVGWTGITHCGSAG